MHGGPVMHIASPLPVAALAALCALAVIHDLLFRRIPNGLVLAGIALGLLFQTWAANGVGLFSPGGSGIGYTGALLGGLAGLGLFLPLYALRAMGAGDVKLIAMAGVWLGATGIAWAALWALLAGGVLSLLAALAAGAMRKVLSNVRFIVTHWLALAQVGRVAALEAPAQVTGRLPYAVAIAAGVVIETVRLAAAA
jgi:prepilin peptidase CpaA